MFSVNQLAERVRDAGKRMGYHIKVKHIENPRIEKEEHYYNPKYSGLLELGLEPHFLTDAVLDNMLKVIEAHKDSINRDAIFRGVKWK